MLNCPNTCTFFSKDSKVKKILGELASIEPPYKSNQLW